MHEFCVRLALAALTLFLHAHVFTLTKLMGYKHFEPNRETILVTCCTNGLGHVHQMERVLSVLQDVGLKFPVIALAKETKVPAYKLNSIQVRPCYPIQHIAAGLF